MNRSCLLTHGLPGPRLVAVLAAAGCVGACLVPAGAAAARAFPPPAVPRGGAQAQNLGAARFAGLGGAVLERRGGPALVLGSRPGRSLRADGSPGIPVANPKTSTVYLPVQCTNAATAASCAATASHVLDVINTATCTASSASGCRVAARAKAGKGPFVAALDDRTDTVYVANQFGNTVSVIDGATCNARITRGCATPLAAVKVGKFPVGIAFNPATRTVYVANLNSGSVSVINAATCNAVTTAGCGQSVKTITDTLGPGALAVNAATDTVYAANTGLNGNGDTVSVINGATCNGSTGTGCGQAPPTITVGSGPFWDVADQATDTIYTANNNDGTVSVINGATCNGAHTSGCGHTPPAVTTGAGAGFAAPGPGRHTLLVLNTDDNTLSAINTATCTGAAPSGCPRLAPAAEAAPSHGPAYTAFPGAFTLIPKTSSLYVVNVGGSNVVSVTRLPACTATTSSGCRHLAPAVPDHEYLLSADTATNTIYASRLVSPRQRGRIDVINGATCHTRDLSGCAPVAEIPAPADVGALDDTTHTLYASGSGSGTVFVINTATCNATDTAGCAHRPPTTAVGAAPGPPVLNPATGTLYVPLAQATTANRVAVVNAATCNAEITSGCGQAPATVNVGPGTSVLAVSVHTDTVYAPSYADNTVAVINGATCNATDHAGCGHLAATAKVGPGPIGVAVNDRTHTAYVANNANGDSPGTVSVINAATCNGAHTSGCHRRFPVMATGRAPWLVAADVRTGAVYVGDFSSAEVTILNGTRCNASVTSGCRQAGHQQAVGSLPHSLAINPRTHTVYVANFFQAGTMTIFQTTQH